MNRYEPALTLPKGRAGIDEPITGYGSLLPGALAAAEITMKEAPADGAAPLAADVAIANGRWSTAHVEQSQLCD
jgi:hypothetical protein